MKKLLNLLFILSIMSTQLWAAEPATPAKSAALAAAAAGAVTSLSGGSPEAPAEFESKAIHEGKESAESGDYNKILAGLRQIVMAPEFRITKEEWATLTPDELLEKTNCGHTVRRLIKKITQNKIDIHHDHYMFHFEYDLDLDLGPDEFQGTMEEFMSKSKISRDLFEDSTKKDYQFFYIWKYAHSPDQYHVSLILKIDNPPSSSRYIILQTWYETYSLQEWLMGLNNPSPLVSKEKYAFHQRMQSRYNPTKELRAADIKKFMAELFIMHDLRMPTMPALYYIRKFDLPNPSHFMNPTLSIPSPIIAINAAEASAASPLPIEPATKCADPDCPKEGAQIGG